jgi:cellulose synthase/poly-beta-1,6-N-acetylglucosamine synthase-like glycosyltransferase
VNAHALPWAWTLAVLVFGLTQALLLAYAAHRLLTLWRWHRRPPAAAACPPVAELPRVTVQLPLFNECAVVERLLDAVAALDYPRERLEVQVLDDSTDATTARARERVRYWRERGLAIELLHRETRDGFKAGALAAGLARARGELLAVFDADFVPPGDFLRRLVPRFADPRVGMVQARWTHLNRERSALTAAQAVMLDAHFALEHEARMGARLFFNFNGTAGAWRRACIEDAGGWTHDTLTEDLDLSYRAQLRGWRFVVANDLEVPAELPSDVLALRSQQRRWAKGSIQTARKLLPALLRAPLPARVKLEAVLHLTANVAYPLLLLSGLLLPLVVALPSRLSPALAALAESVSIVVGVAPVVAFLAAGQAAVGRPARRRARDVACALLAGAGLTVNNTFAVIEALGSRLGDWERTPKTGEVGGATHGAVYPARADLTPALELVLALVFAALAVTLARLGHPRSAPFLLLLASGLGYLGALSLKGTLAGLRTPPAGRPHLVLGARTAAR